MQATSLRKASAALVVFLGLPSAIALMVLGALTWPVLWVLGGSSREADSIRAGRSPTMMRSIYPVLAATLLLAGCAHVKFADGQRVAIEHDNSRAPEAVAALQAQADQACLASGGKVPAKLVSNLPVHNAAPAWMLRHTATFACAS